ncbi:ELP3 like acetyltransferase [Tribonema minus]|uniref:tRNA carboxymethyluridine synthase n=1 Tax=Tribonema minus TaxID=303371 RepID=A0A836CEU0_9STRA|nr:ELP3 like acetyltransferase [Tribonema minus]
MGPPSLSTKTPMSNPVTDIEALVMDEQHENNMPALRKLLDDMDGMTDWKDANKLLKQFRKVHKFTPTKNVLNHIHRSSGKKSATLDRLLITKQVRSMSGVLVVTLLTSPHPSYTDPVTGKRHVQRFSCKHNCYYCPNEPAHEGNNFVPQPRSYLHDEPGVLRANRCGFDSVTQFRDRISVYVINGHPIDKIEVLVLGGTWSEYPRPYQEEFIRDIFYAANTTFEDRVERLSLKEELTRNMDAQARVIGITLETRPDTINLEEIERLRSYGCTRLQIGVQHTDDAILTKISREHAVADTIAAIRLLKDNCFKVDIHLMPNLPGATVEGDEAMFTRVLQDPDLQADQWKIYPCSVVPWTVIEKWHREGTYIPYADSDLLEMLMRVKSRVHPWIRLNRVIRDIPNQYISGGCATTNMRQMLQQRMAKRGEFCKCMRCREVRNQEFKDPTLTVRRYAASGGTEYFISFESPDEKVLYGFLRLRIPSRRSQCLLELKGCALIRELHVYGKLKEVTEGGRGREQGGGKGVKDASQHQGLGSQLLAKAEDIALSYGYGKLAVISGVGVRRYYERFGYELGETYQIKTLPRARRWRRRLILAATVAAAAAIVGVAVGRRRTAR